MPVEARSHAGIGAILEAASAVDLRTEIVFGGFHLVTTPLVEIHALGGESKGEVEGTKDCTGALPESPLSRD